MRRLLIGLASIVAVAGGLAACGAPAEPQTPSEQQSRCSTARPLPVGDSERTIVTGGRERSYVLHVPPGYRPTERTPLVLMFHGLGGDPQTVLESTEMGTMADQHNAILAVPLGRGKPSQWRFRSPISNPRSDVAFVRQLVKQLKKDACVDSSRTYAAGFSNGSALTLALACDASTQFAAYAAVSGPYYEPWCGKAPAASIIYFHGTADTTVPYRGANTVIGHLPPVNDIMAKWAKHDRCPSAGTRTRATSAVRHFSWVGCEDGTSVDIFAVVGGVHGWPGGGPMSPGRTSRTKNSPVDATALIWKFFARHPAGGQ
ncbi:extracellular catalytic domain type 1 short-chain-length polyhydroxyalkanoate depolymerase [Aeromicrobium chenweiae]|uniref:extracellular catalytic domain type 1 short-chain-length polyhydroxyalkanoate depolymerase n=1 Tax=Aeromicrobium chenweiae TaxID=2079793 RepID=UPI00131F2431|nr:PHB depolymerase family esterase [Aeromicrobium chenweiae]